MDCSARVVCDQISKVRWSGGFLTHLETPNRLPLPAQFVPAIPQLLLEPSLLPILPGHLPLEVVDLAKMTRSQRGDLLTRIGEVPPGFALGVLRRLEKRLQVGLGHLQRVDWVGISKVL